MGRFLLPYIAGTFLVIAFAWDISANSEDRNSEDTVNKTLVWPDGTRYVGEVRNGKRWGKGTIFWQDGTRFVGTFANDLRNGPGTMILPDGSIYNGYFENDALVDAPAAVINNTTPVSVASVSEEADSEEAISEEKPQEIQEVAPSKVIAETPVEIAVSEKEDLPEPKQVVSTEESVPLDLNVTQLTEEVRKNLESMIDLWGASWSDKNVVQYLAYYSDKFVVPGNQSRRQWEALRRSRLKRPKSINVSISYEKVEITELNTAKIVFMQRYQSDIFSDKTRKEFVLNKEGEFWKIVSERSL